MSTTKVESSAKWKDSIVQINILPTGLPARQRPVLNTLRDRIFGNSPAGRRVPSEIWRGSLAERCIPLWSLHGLISPQRWSAESRKLLIWQIMRINAYVKIEFMSNTRLVPRGSLCCTSKKWRLEDTTYRQYIFRSRHSITLIGLPNLHRRRRRDATKQFSRVGSGGVNWA